MYTAFCVVCACVLGLWLVIAGFMDVDADMVIEVGQRRVSCADAASASTMKHLAHMPVQIVPHSSCAYA